MRRTYGLAVLAVAGLLLTGCGASQVRGEVNGAAHATASPNPSPASSSSSQPGSTPTVASISSTAVGDGRNCDTTSPNAIAAFRKVFKITPGRCFDRIESKVTPDPSGAEGLRALYDDFCSKIGMEDQIAGQTGHGYYSATTLGYIVDSDDSGGSCTWGGARFMGSSALGAAARRGIMVEYERVRTDTGEEWATAGVSYGNRGAIWLKQIFDVGVAADLYSAGKDEAGDDIKSLLAYDGRGTLVLVTANSHGLYKMLAPVARRALEAAALLD